MTVRYQSIMPLPTSRPGAILTPDTHARLLALAARWRSTPTLERMSITHDMLISFALPLLEAAIPFEGFTGVPADDFEALGKVLQLVPAKQAV